MTGIGIGIIVAAYSVGVWGYCLVKGYDISYFALWRTTPPKWPADIMPPDEMFPGTGSSPNPTQAKPFNLNQTGPTGISQEGTTGRGAI